MYYAAACCCDSGAVCECGEEKYASVSFLISARQLGYTGFTELCDRVCRQIHRNAFGDVAQQYVEAKVYMKCGGPNTTPGVFSSGYILPQSGFQTFDPGSIVILDTKQSWSLESWHIPGDELDCCDPPFQNPYCYGGPRQRTSFSTGNSSLYPFDVYNPDGGPCANVTPTASTKVAMGDDFGGDAPAEVQAQPNKYFRKTSCSMQYNLLERWFWYDRDADGNVDDYDITRLIGGSFNCGGAILKIRRWSLIGDECDYYATGEEIVTEVYSNGWHPTPLVNYSNFQGPTYCGLQEYTPYCCGIDERRTFDPTEGFQDITLGGESNGGIYGLQFFEDPPPDLP